MSDDPYEDLKDKCMNDAFWAADEIWRLQAMHESALKTCDRYDGEIERLEGLTVDLADALWNWWGDGSFADPDHVEHAVWCEFDNVPADCLCGRSLFPEDKTNE